MQQQHDQSLVDLVHRDFI